MALLGLVALTPTCDETSAAAVDFMQARCGQTRPSSAGSTLTAYADGMIKHEAMIGTMLKAMDNLGIGATPPQQRPHQNSWPDAAHLFFQLVSRRYRSRAMLITSNCNIGEWRTWCSALPLLLEPAEGALPKSGDHNLLQRT
jgi:IstB-like ATP binding protein